MADQVVLHGEATDTVKLLRAILYVLCVMAGISMDDALNGGRMGR